jgi:hypothetical protein
MKELMVHVERIVRPIAASQARKLRMRTELMAHLELAMEEERHRFPGDERAAIEQARLRLGDPAELTRKLQRSVPKFEHALLGPIPISSRLERLEKRLAKSPGQRGPMTLGHKMILTVMATLLYAPFQISMYRATQRGMPAAHLALASVVIPIGGLSLLLACYYFVFAAACPNDGLHWRGNLKRGAIIFSLQMILVFVSAFAIANHAAPRGDIAVCAGASVALLMVATLIAKQVSKLRRPYDPWLALDIAE